MRPRPGEERVFYVSVVLFGLLTVIPSLAAIVGGVWGPGAIEILFWALLFVVGVAGLSYLLNLILDFFVHRSYQKAEKEVESFLELMREYHDREN